MAEVYELLQYVVPGSYSIRDGVTFATLAGWEVAGSELRTTTPVNATRPFSGQLWRPYPYLYNATYDLSSVAEIGSLARFRVRGTVNKVVAFSYATAMDTYGYMVDEGDHYSFVSEWGPEVEIADPSNFYPITSVNFTGPGSGPNSLTGLTTNVVFEIEISEPPPPPVMIMGAVWGSSYLGTSTACETDMSEVTLVELVSATLTYYEDDASYVTVPGHCAYGIEWDQAPTETYEIDVGTLDISTSTENVVTLTAFTHEGLFESRNVMLLIEVIVTIDGVQYPATLTAIRYPWG